MLQFHYLRNPYNFFEVTPPKKLLVNEVQVHNGNSVNNNAIEKFRWQFYCGQRGEVLIWTVCDVGSSPPGPLWPGIGRLLLAPPREQERELWVDKTCHLSPDPANGPVKQTALRRSQGFPILNVRIEIDLHLQTSLKWVCARASVPGGGGGGRKKDFF